MLQCKDCEHFSRNEVTGEISFACDPFTNVKEPECLAKWQLVKINQMVAGYQATLNYYRKLAPLQEKMFKAMERELDDISEADKWKISDDEGGETTKDDNNWDAENHPFQ